MTRARRSLPPAAGDNSNNPEIAAAQTKGVRLELNKWPTICASPLADPSITETVAAERKDGADHVASAPYQNDGAPPMSL
jgi:hypothetical protein